MRPASWPRYFPASASDSILTFTTLPRFGPSVPGAYPRGTASSVAGEGLTIWTTARSRDQPRPNWNASRCALARPHDSRRWRVQSLASRIWGDPVTRGPITSVDSRRCP